MCASMGKVHVITLDGQWHPRYEDHKQPPLTTGLMIFMADTAFLHYILHSWKNKQPNSL